MSDTVPVQYVGPFDAVEIAATGDEVKRGHIIDVPVALAGRPPVGVHGDENYDPGEGLLAQVDNWVAGDLDAMNVDALRAYADVLGVNLEGATRKGDVIKAIRTAELLDPPATEDAPVTGADPQE